MSQSKLAEESVTESRPAVAWSPVQVCFFPPSASAKAAKWTVFSFLQEPLQTATCFSHETLCSIVMYIQKRKIGQEDKLFVFIINNSHLNFCLSLEVVAPRLPREDMLYFCSALPYYVQQ